MITSKKLPTFDFIDSKGDVSSVDLSKNIKKIRCCAEAFQGKAESGDVIGICFQNCPDLVYWWLGALLAGLRPLMMQYPTNKQSREYWQSSVTDTLSKTGITSVVCSSEVESRIEEFSPGLAFSSPIRNSKSSKSFVLDDYSIIQLSSGTTGVRKAVEFSSTELHKHSKDFNEVLKLDETDVIVSWLPLYHDMGYVACFVMPLILGVKVAMMDPETWVKDKEILYRTIEKVRGTVCYMPNFGFEVMSKIAAPKMDSMRRWISCSEPVLEGTSKRFIESINSPAEHFSACYAMAENIFAMSMSVGIQTRNINDQSVISNGSAIPGVEIKIIDEEIWIRSPTSLKVSQVLLGWRQYYRFRWFLSHWGSW